MTSATSKSVGPEYPGRIIVDLSAIVRNWQSLAGLVQPAECAAVVKADAYGLGADRVIPALCAAGCRTFFVATPEEAAAARRLAPRARLFVLDGLMPGSAPALGGTGAIPVAADMDQLREWAAFARQSRQTLPAAVQVDTGLNRLGLSPLEIHQLESDKDALAPLDLVLVMSHLASADDPKSAKNETQRQAFLEALDHLPKTAASLAASDGLMLGPPYHFDLVRPGYALYGGQAFQGRPTPVEPVVTVVSKVLQLRNLSPGDSVGYSETFTARHPMRIAIIAAGYADGIPRHASAATDDIKAHVAIGGRLAPVIGRVSMDLIAVDISSLEEGAVHRGDTVELIGPTISLEAAGQAAGTIGYEILTNLSRRFERVYIAGERAKASPTGTPRT